MLQTGATILWSTPGGEAPRSDAPRLAGQHCSLAVRRRCHARPHHAGLLVGVGRAFNDQSKELAEMFT